MANNENDKKTKLTHKLKCMIIERLQLEDVTPGDVSDDDPIFDGGLGLDSLDALDLVLLLEKEFNVRIKDPQQARKILSTIDTLADYILTDGSVGQNKDKR